MTQITTKIAIQEAERFIRLAKKALEISLDREWRSKENAATKRASMDLTRALAEMRKPQ